MLLKYVLSRCKNIQLLRDFLQEKASNFQGFYLIKFQVKT